MTATIGPRDGIARPDRPRSLPSCAVNPPATETSTSLDDGPNVSVGPPPGSEPVTTSAPDAGQIRPLNPAELGMWLAFLETSTRALEQLDRDLQARHDLSLADYEILAFLSEADERQLPMTELAHRSLVSKSRLTYRVDRLVAKGFVERRRCDSDGRRVWATLTDTGFTALEEAWPLHLAGVRNHVIEPVHPDDLPALHRALDAMRATLT